jgi:hypothetical protein
LKHYDISQKVAGSSPDEVDFFFFQFPLPSIRTMTSGVDSASNRNEYQEDSWEVKARLARKADNLTASTSHTPMGLHGLLQG